MTDNAGPPTGPDRQPLSAEQRAEVMCRMRAEGSSLQSIADSFGLTRERVRQIIRGANGPGKREAIAARQAKSEQARLDLRVRALDLCREQPGLTAEQAAAAVGVSTAELRAALGEDARRVLISTHQAQPVFSELVVLEHLRQGAAVAGEPLTVRRYEGVRGSFGGASAPLILQRFGTWRAACVSAGVQHGQPVRTNYERRWARDQLVDAVAQYLSGAQARGSFADYERWARGVDGAPSGQTIRTQLGTWSQAKAEALGKLSGPGAGLGSAVVGSEFAGEQQVP